MFKPIVAGIDAVAVPGEVLAIRGPSGSGVTVLARLCAGLLTPSAGAIRLDGADLSTYPPGTAMLVDHHITLQTGTLRDNLHLGAEPMDDAVLNAALDMVALTPALARRGGLDLMLDEVGSTLSGGQLRRVSLARALCRNPKILVIDGALDSVEAGLAQSIISELKARRIIVVLASTRAETLALADRAIVLGETKP
jgi:ABC-type bacteriocin/lantibiotic exporter with double-glycine peptidase domain